MPASTVEAMSSPTKEKQPIRLVETRQGSCATGQWWWKPGRKIEKFLSNACNRCKTWDHQNAAAAPALAWCKHENDDDMLEYFHTARRGHFWHGEAITGTYGDFKDMNVQQRFTALIPSTFCRRRVVISNVRTRSICNVIYHYWWETLTITKSAASWTARWRVSARLPHIFCETLLSWERGMSCL